MVDAGYEGKTVLVPSTPMPLTATGDTSVDDGVDIIDSATPAVSNAVASTGGKAALAGAAATAGGNTAAAAGKFNSAGSSGNSAGDVEREKARKAGGEEWAGRTTAAGRQGVADCC